jgi:hypothetical protein
MNGALERQNSFDPEFRRKLALHAKSASFDPAALGSRKRAATFHREPSLYNNRNVESDVDLSITKNFLDCLPSAIRVGFFRALCLQSQPIDMNGWIPSVSCTSLLRGTWTLGVLKKHDAMMLVDVKYPSYDNPLIVMPRQATENFADGTRLGKQG